MTQTNEVAFNLMMRRDSLSSLAMDEQGNHDIEVGGSLGGLREITVHEGLLLEVHGSNGILRITLPVEYLELISVHLASKRKDDEGSNSQQRHEVEA
jgi:hypothetical protein